MGDVVDRIAARKPDRPKPMQTSLCEPLALPASLVAQGFASAIAAAAEFAGATSPNPPVGCIIYDAQGSVLACEAHRKSGSLHAEAAAIAACRAGGVYERIHTIVVTLEPCNHFGRTPPCTAAILGTPAQVVWIGVRDQYPYVAGEGARVLQERNVSVRWLETLDCPLTPRLLQAVRRLAGPFAKSSTINRPWITLKQALTRDGSMIPPAGQKTFTSPASLLIAHKLRRRADAIITGSGTILADRPFFTVRRVEDHKEKRRKLVILDRRGRTPSSYLNDAHGRGFDVWLEKDIDQALARLGDAGVLEALVEAGPNLLAAFRARDLWDEQIVIQQRLDEKMQDDIVVSTRLGAVARIREDADVLWYH